MKQIITNKDKPASANRKPKNAIHHLLPETTPKYGGNIRLPAPKNIANNAKPTTNTSFTLIVL